MAEHRPTLPTRPFLTIYIAWHPKFEQGASLARALYDHYRRNLYQNIAGGTGIPVIYRCEPPAGSTVPIDIDLDTADSHALDDVGQNLAHVRHALPNRR